MAIFEEINKILTKVLDEYGEFVLEELRTNSQNFGLEDKNVNASGDLVDSLNKEIVLESSTGLAQLILGFEPYGRFSDMSAQQINHSQLPPVSELAKWIRDRGLEKFKISKELRTIRELRGEDEMIRDLAWRMSWTIYNKETNRKKRRKWRFNKILYGTIDRVIKDIAFSFTTNELNFLNKIASKQIEIKL